MTATPAVSVVMAVYNGAAHLSETLESLRAQTLSDWELIAVDDCSADGSVAVLESFGDPRIRVIRSAENGGPVIARNRAFADVRGRYVAGLDQDDLSLPERFARQVAFLDRYPDTVLVSTAADQLVEGKRVPGHWPRPLSRARIDWLMLIRNPIAWSSVMFRTDAARRLDPFERPERRYVEDFDLYQRLRAFGRIDQIDEVLMLYRVHPGGASQRFTDMMYAHAEEVLRDRHRALLGEGTPDIAGLLVRHVMDGAPVPDRATLDLLFETLTGLRDALTAQHGYSRAELDYMDGELAKLWWRLNRTGIRSGRLALHQSFARNRPRVAARQLPDLLASQAIGAVRRLRTRSLKG
ncbi:glycosyltransferase family 2 protein [Sphingomonas sp. S2-65]|uniref:glycosyltransferase family 2 protein n=1 Tax=Sphingomonas sp. S2-65 TaxID=2903960 RepID=UPI001F37A470|nr:glycosyltransferase [Sphingomonas sp. S2-65]UYY59604.1 glycosyltransferase [Sphingomonas sp. S2-65]